MKKKVLISMLTIALMSVGVESITGTQIAFAAKNEIILPGYIYL
ncbi:MULTISPECIES: hypothetical protein [unclassified Lactobacillus]|nr:MULTISPECIES: hypothetical protein [unclassified Lactobacillus]